MSFNKNGLWIKENVNNLERIITASNPDGHFLSNLEIFELDKNFELIKKISSKSANIKTNNWILKDVKVFNYENGIFSENEKNEYMIKSNYNFEKLITLFNNSDTFSFVEILLNFKKMIKKGYNEEFLKQSFHSMMTLPFYLFVMTSLATILSLHTMKYSENFKFIIIGLVASVLIYYFKDLSLALGKTDRIPLILSIWSPIIVLSCFSLIGVIQINEK